MLVRESVGTCVDLNGVGGGYLRRCVHWRVRRSGESDSAVDSLPKNAGVDDTRVGQFEKPFLLAEI